MRLYRMLCYDDDVWSLSSFFIDGVMSRYVLSLSLSLSLAASSSLFVGGEREREREREREGQKKQAISNSLHIYNICCLSLDISSDHSKSRILGKKPLEIERFRPAPQAIFDQSNALKTLNLALFFVTKCSHLDNGHSRDSQRSPKRRHEKKKSPIMQHEQ